MFRDGHCAQASGLIEQREKYIYWTRLQYGSVTRLQELGRLCCRPLGGRTVALVYQ